MELEPGETIEFTFRLATDADGKIGKTSWLVTLQRSQMHPQRTVHLRLKTYKQFGAIFAALKSPFALSMAEFGDVVNWTVTALNNGPGLCLRWSYPTDTPGSGFGQCH